jgi:hypothetical protein
VSNIDRDIEPHGVFDDEWLAIDCEYPNGSLIDLQSRSAYKFHSLIYALHMLYSYNHIADTSLAVSLCK